MSDKYRIIHYEEGFALQEWIPECIYSSGRKYMFWGEMRYNTYPAHWEFIYGDEGHYEHNGVDSQPYFVAYVKKFASVEEAENWIKGLKQEIVKEIDYDTKTTENETVRD